MIFHLGWHKKNGHHLNLNNFWNNQSVLLIFQIYQVELMFYESTKFDLRDAMDYWAKDIYIWGLFSAEVYLRSSIAIQRTVRMSWISCPLTDLGTFSVVGSRELKNNIFWGSTPPEHCLQRPLHSVKCTVWVAISKHGIIGPFWFEDDNERSVTINTERYVQVPGKLWTALGRRRGVVRVLQWFQQDGATPTPQSIHWHGYSSVSLTDWSAAVVTRSGRRIHRTWTPKFLSVGIP